MTLLLASLGLAADASPKYTLIACPPPTLIDTLPAPGQADVPVDAPFVAVVRPGCAGAVLSWTVTLSTDADVVSEGELVADEWGGAIGVFEPGDLAPDTAYTARLTPLSGGEEVEVGFSTGAAEAAGVAEAPTFEIVSSGFSRDDGGLVVIEATPAEDPDALSFLVLTLDDGTVLDAQPATSEDALTASAPDAGRLDEVCASITQVDALGEAHESEVACERIPACGCATPTPPAGWTALLALFALRRRR